MGTHLLVWRIMDTLIVNDGRCRGLGIGNCALAPVGAVDVLCSGPLDRESLYLAWPEHTASYKLGPSSQSLASTRSPSRKEAFYHVTNSYL